ncbi:hypothetical protein HY29_18400, partial [Hyphomonas beringensis]
TNGNYVVSSPEWNNIGASKAGAVTWGNGEGGTVGEVSKDNSLVGKTANDSATNSLVGKTANDFVGSGRVTALSNGNYVVVSPDWNTDTASKAGAVTWGNGASGVTGEVSATNSLVGKTANDYVGSGGVIALTNGNYVVLSYKWNNIGAANAGAVTWGNGEGGTVGEVSATNSLVGTTAYDRVGATVENPHSSRYKSSVIALSNGNYVVASPDWNTDTASKAGAVTWGNGASGVTGVVSDTNSLVGSTANDWVGSEGVTELTNGNYVVVSERWANGGASKAGAVTWGSGTVGVTGVVSDTNSLVGSTANDWVGSEGVTELTNGNYVVVSERWANGGASKAGAVTWGSGTVGVTGVVSDTNSLVGSQVDDLVGSQGVTALTNGNYVVASANWANGTMGDAGAVTWGDGTKGVTGLVSATNSLVGPAGSSRLALSGGVYEGSGTFIAATSPLYGRGESGHVLVGLTDPSQLTFSR